MLKNGSKSGLFAVGLLRISAVNVRKSTKSGLLYLTDWLSFERCGWTYFTIFLVFMVKCGCVGQMQQMYKIQQKYKDIEKMNIYT